MEILSLEGLELDVHIAKFAILFDLFLFDAIDDVLQKDILLGKIKPIVHDGSNEQVELFLVEDYLILHWHLRVVTYYRVLLLLFYLLLGLDLSLLR